MSFEEKRHVEILNTKYLCTWTSMLSRLRIRIFINLYSIFVGLFRSINYGSDGTHVLTAPSFDISARWSEITRFFDDAKRISLIWNYSRNATATIWTFSVRLFIHSLTVCVCSSRPLLTLMIILQYMLLKWECIMHEAGRRRTDNAMCHIVRTAWYK